MQKKLSQMEDLVYRLERKSTGPKISSSSFTVDQEKMQRIFIGSAVTEDLDDLLEMLDDAKEITRRLQTIPIERAAELANEAKDHLNTVRETAEAEISQELEVRAICFIYPSHQTTL